MLLDPRENSRRLSMCSCTHLPAGRQYFLGAGCGLKDPSAFKLGEILFEEFELAALAAGPLPGFVGPQLYAPDLAGDGLGQIRELQAADAFVRGKTLPQEGEMEPGRTVCPGGLPTWAVVSV